MTAHVPFAVKRCYGCTQSPPINSTPDSGTLWTQVQQFLRNAAIAMLRRRAGCFLARATVRAGGGGGGGGGGRARREEVVALATVAQRVLEGTVWRGELLAVWPSGHPPILQEQDSYRFLYKH